MISLVYLFYLFILSLVNKKQSFAMKFISKQNEIRSFFLVVFQHLTVNVSVSLSLCNKEKCKNVK